MRRVFAVCHGTLQLIWSIVTVSLLLVNKSIFGDYEHSTNDYMSVSSYYYTEETQID